MKPSERFLSITFLGCLLLLSGALARADATKDGKFFQLHILPLLKENCFACHGAMKTSGLDLRSRAMLLKGGAHGVVVVPGQAERSRLYRLVAGLEKIPMPPARKLSAAQIADLKAWINAGAVWPADVSAGDAKPWAFRKPLRPSLPKVQNTAWCRNPIDRFILAKLEAKGLHPAPPADKRALIRRVTYDLLGLPPTPQEVDAFLRDSSPNAYEKVVDRLLADPRYGERWARHWLDLARYAESEGFKSDEVRPNAWRYRDYVIQSLNADKPYDRFLKEQLAGDELFPDDPNALIATGFNRHWADESNATNLLQRRQEILNDITDTVGSSLLGLTLGCARCHNHKYDPIPQKDYYRLQAFFAAIRPRDDLPLLTSEQRAAYQQQLQAWEAKTAAIRADLAKIEEPYRQRFYRDRKKRFSPDVQEAMDTPPDKRAPLQWILYYKGLPQVEYVTADVKAMKPEEQKRWQELTKRLDEFKSLKPTLPVAIGITDVGREAPKTYTLAVGVYDKPLEAVEPGFLTLLTSDAPTSLPARSPGDPGEEAASTGRRSALAHWIASPDNPLTARVLVNRLWQHHFGLGLVATPSDFGNTGDKPTHSELLDWLASNFVERGHWVVGSLGNGEKRSPPAASSQLPNYPTTQLPSPYACGWSLKRMHRLMVTSATYRQAATFEAKAAKIDPEDTLLWRFRRQRLEGEVIRDAVLAVSGELNPKMGGPSVFPELPSGITTRGGWKETSDLQERNRRSIYVFVKRNLRYPLFEVFDMPDTHEPCARRLITTTAPQALMLLNDERILRSAQAFAERVAKEAGNDRAAQVERAYRLAFARPPDAEERQSALAFLARQERLIEAQPHIRASKAESRNAAQDALTDFCHALLNANEFIYVE